MPLGDCLSPRNMYVHITYVRWFRHVGTLRMQEDEPSG